MCIHDCETEQSFYEYGLAQPGLNQMIIVGEFWALHSENVVG